jgi:16S rRNA (guanine966-N2)-methyltransferase
MARGSGIRVIAGSARGRRLVVPEGYDVRPTKDMVREAMFSALTARDAIVGARVLDLYAGTGALGIEALSRGAAHAVFVEHDRRALDAIRINLSTTGFGDASRVLANRVERALAVAPPPEAPFDLVVCDPPYDLPDAAVYAVLQSLTHPGWMTETTLVSVERPAGARIEAPPPLRTHWERTFGDTLVVFLATDED